MPFTLFILYPHLMDLINLQKNQVKTGLLKVEPILLLKSV